MSFVPTLRATLALVRNDRALFLVLLAISLFSGLLSGIGDPFFLKLLIDSLGTGGIGRFLVLAAVLAGVYTVSRLISLQAALLTRKLKNRLCESLSSKVFRAFYRLPYPEVLRRDTGYFVSRIYDEPAKITEGVDLLVELFSSAVMFAGALSLCLWLSWKVAIVLSIIVPTLIVISDRFGARIRQSTLDETESEAELRDGLGRAVESYKTVNVFGLQAAAHHAVGERLDAYLGHLYDRTRHSWRFQTASGIFLSYAELAVLISVGVQVIRGQMTIGGMFGFITAYWRVVNTFKTLTTLIPKWAQLGAQLGRVDEMESLADGVEPGEPGDAIAIDDLVFSYSGLPVLDRCSLSVEPGERLLLVGPNGSGKSTLTHVVAGFLHGPEGRVSLPARERVSALLLPFGFIPGTVRDNLGLDGLDEEARRRTLVAAAELGLDDKLDRDPASLSAGEQKKCQILMTLTKDADFYVLDEPLANVDPASKDLVMDRILERTDGKGLIVVMHGDDRYHRRFDRCIDLGAPRLTAVGA